MIHILQKIALEKTVETVRKLLFSTSAEDYIFWYESGADDTEYLSVIGSRYYPVCIKLVYLQIGKLLQILKIPLPCNPYSIWESPILLTNPDDYTILSGNIYPVTENINRFLFTYSGWSINEYSYTFSDEWYEAGEEWYRAERKKICSMLPSIRPDILMKAFNEFFDFYGSVEAKCFLFQKQVGYGPECPLDIFDLCMESALTTYDLSNNAVLVLIEASGTESHKITSGEPISVAFIHPHCALMALYESLKPFPALTNSQDFI